MEEKKRTYYIDTIIGFVLFYFNKRKTFCLILSSMRCGSTLLKALLGEAEDVSHITEFDFQVEGNKYYCYKKFYYASDKQIIVFKRPAWITWTDYPQIPPLDFKFIVLIRNPIITVFSVKRMLKEFAPDFLPLYTDLDLIEKYWCQAYLNIYNRVKDFELVTYESLLDEPIETTKRLFAYIGSKQQNGTDTYSKPVNGEWKWGSDDGSEKIKSFRVEKEAINEAGILEELQKYKDSEILKETLRLYQLNYLPDSYFNID